MTEQEYWFARTRRGRNRMAPVSWKGWAVIGFFIAMMMLGAGLFGFFMFEGRVITGVTLYVLFGLIGAATFIRLAYAKGDRTHTVDDYRARPKPDDLHDQLGGRR